MYFQPFGPLCVIIYNIYVMCGCADDNPFIFFFEYRFVETLKCSRMRSLGPTFIILPQSRPHAQEISLVPFV